MSVYLIALTRPDEDTRHAIEQLGDVDRSYPLSETLFMISTDASDVEFIIDKVGMY